MLGKNDSINILLAIPSKKVRICIMHASDIWSSAPYNYMVNFASSADPISAKLRQSMKLRHTPTPTSKSAGDTSSLALSAVCTANVQRAAMVMWSM